MMDIDLGCAEYAAYNTTYIIPDSFPRAGRDALKSEARAKTTIYCSRQPLREVIGGDIYDGVEEPQARNAATKMPERSSVWCKSIYAFD